MKKLKILSILLFGILAFACKKDNTDNPPNTDTNLTRFYSVEEAAEDALMLTSLDSSRSIMLIAYAAFDADGIPARINSLVLGKVAENYQGNLIFDEQKRPQLFYVTAKNGTKDNVLLSFSYPANDTVVYSLYYYNWSTQEDSLLQQQKINIENFNSTFTYGNRLAEVAYWNKVADELETVHNNMEKVFNTEIVIKAVSDTRFNTQNLANFLETTADANRSNARIAFSAILYKYLLKLEQDRVHAQLAALSPEDFKNMKVVVHPKGLIPKAEYIYPKESKSLINYIYALFGIGSPTAEAATIPKPIGTPENPNGLPSTGTGTGISIRNGGEPTEIYINCYIMGYSECGVEILGITLADNWGGFGSVEFIPRKNGTYLLNQPPSPQCGNSSYFGAWNMACGGEDYGSGTISISGNSFVLDWKASNDVGNYNCPEEGIIWQIRGSWQ